MVTALATLVVAGMGSYWYRRRRRQRRAQTEENAIERKLIAGSIVVATLAACVGNGGGGAGKAAGHEDAEAVVTWIVDGDTIEVEYVDGRHRHSPSDRHKRPRPG